MKAAVIIPAFDEARTIRSIAERALVCCPKVAVIDDGSRDGTADALAGVGVTLLRHATNLGKAAALATGFDWALAQGAEVVVTLDGDGQHRPEDIPRLLAVAPVPRSMERQTAAPTVCVHENNTTRSAPGLRQIV